MHDMGHADADPLAPDTAVPDANLPDANLADAVVPDAAVPDIGPLIHECVGADTYTGELAPIAPDDYRSASGSTLTLDAPDPDWSAGIAALLAGPAPSMAHPVHISGAVIVATEENPATDLRSDRTFWIADGQATILASLDPDQWASWPPWTVQVGQRVDLDVTALLVGKDESVITNARHWSQHPPATEVAVVRLDAARPVANSDVGRMVTVSGSIGESRRCLTNGDWWCADLDYGPHAPIAIAIEAWRVTEPLAAGTCVDFTGPVAFDERPVLMVRNTRWVRGLWQNLPIAQAPPTVEIDPAGFVPGSIEWTPCDLVAPGAACGRFDVPLDWANPEGETISITIQRLAASAPRQGSMWLLPRFMGLSGWGDHPFVRSSSAALRDAGFDLYLPAQRGTGSSAPIGCRPEQSWLRCLEHVTRPGAPPISGYTTTGIALDVLALMDAALHPDDPVFAFGSYYGTHVLRRMLQIAPDRLTAALASELFPQVWSVLPNERPNEIFDAVLTACAGDSDCSAAFGGDPHGAVPAILQAIGEGECPILPEAGLPESKLHVLMAQSMELDDGPLLSLVALRHAANCSLAGAAALARFEAFVAEGRLRKWHSAHLAMYANIVGGELLGRPLPPWREASRAVTSLSATFTPYFGEHWVGLHWPRPPMDQWMNAQPAQGVDTDTPLLMLNGTLDSVTTVPMAYEYMEDFQNEHQHLVLVPGAHHGVWDYPWRSLADRTECLNTIILRFLAAPTEAIYTDCLVGAKAFDFSSDPDLLEAVFDDVSPWGEPAAP
jgi:pimeloyl-ACP methyl ester carboxylesterase